MLAWRDSSLVVVLLVASFAAGCIDNPVDPDAGREFGRKCTWDVVDAGTGVVYERWTYAYARQGWMIWQEVDYGGNGEIDYRIDYYLDDSGVLQREEIDEDGSGAFDLLLRHFYDGRGRKTRTDESNGDGDPTLRRHFQYDQQSRLIHREDDYGVDGGIDARTSWFYDDDDNPVRVELDNGPDGRTNQIVSQDFELIADIFRMVLRRGDWDGDGVWDYSERVVWSSKGLLMEREIDENGDGTIDERWRYFYDDAGSRTSGYGDTNGDGNWDIQQRYSSECVVWTDPDR